MSELVTIRRSLLERGTAELRDAGIPEPRREAARLWMEVTGERRDAWILHPERAPSPAAFALFRRAIARRARGEPIAHVTGRVGFRRLRLRSDSRALIPRPESEGLVDLLLTRVRSGRLADIGTGTGCLALSLAQEGEFAQVVAVDLSADALALAGENRRETGIPVELIRGDLCSPLAHGAFDALVSNPPYLTAAEYEALDSSVRVWEPAMALVGGSDGLEASTRVLKEGRRALRPGGWLALEVDCSRASACAGRAVMLGWNDVTVDADLFGRERYLLARRNETP